MRLFRYLALVLSGVAALGAPGAHAQGNPRQILVGIILQLQTVTPEPAWYGEQVWQSLITQAGIPALRKLGPVQDIFLAGQQQLPRGWVYSMSAQHPKGQSAWLLGISTTSNRIEYADFDVGAPVAAPPLPNSSDACKRFPRLC